MYRYVYRYGTCFWRPKLNQSRWVFIPSLRIAQAKRSIVESVFSELIKSELKHWHFCSSLSKQWGTWKNFLMLFLRGQSKCARPSNTTPFRASQNTAEQPFYVVVWRYLCNCSYLSQTKEIGIYFSLQSSINAM